jgi:hypothetical protein
MHRDVDSEDLARALEVVREVTAGVLAGSGA